MNVVQDGTDASNVSIVGVLQRDGSNDPAAIAMQSYTDADGKKAAIIRISAIRGLPARSFGVRVSALCVEVATGESVGSQAKHHLAFLKTGFLQEVKVSVRHMGCV